MFGHVVFIVFAPLYFIVCAVSFVQFIRVFKATKFKYYLLTSEQMLVSLFTACRCTAFLIFYFGKSCDDVEKGASCVSTTR